MDPELEVRSLVSVLQSPVAQFERGKMKSANCLEECNSTFFLATGGVNSAPFERGLGEELMCKFLARKSRNSSPVSAQLM